MIAGQEVQCLSLPQRHALPAMIIVFGDLHPPHYPLRCRGVAHVVRGRHAEGVALPRRFRGGSRSVAGCAGGMATGEAHGGTLSGERNGSNPEDG